MLSVYIILCKYHTDILEAMAMTLFSFDLLSVGI